MGRELWAWGFPAEQHIDAGYFRFTPARESRGLQNDQNESAGEESLRI